MSTDPGPLPEDAIESGRIESGVIPTGDALADHHSAHGAAPRAQSALVLASQLAATEAQPAPLVERYGGVADRVRPVPARR